jgi:hypothetical protein
MMPTRNYHCVFDEADKRKIEYEALSGEAGYPYEPALK